MIGEWFGETHSLSLALRACTCVTAFAVGVDIASLLKEYLMMRALCLWCVHYCSNYVCTSSYVVSEPQEGYAHRGNHKIQSFLVLLTHEISSSILPLPVVTYSHSYFISSSTLHTHAIKGNPFSEQSFWSRLHH